MHRRALRAVVSSLAVALAGVSGCMFSKVREDHRIIAGFGQVQGTIEAMGWDGSPLLVGAARLPDSDREAIVISSQYTLRTPQTYSLRLFPGRYLMIAVADLDRDGKYDDGEPAALSREVVIVAGESVDEVDLRISADFQIPNKYEKQPRISEDVLARGDVLPLSAPKFGPELARKGVWEPTKYTLTERPGIYLLEPFDPTKTPVLFVHGMGGYPREFARLIERLDRASFQPWVALYPSGYDLERVGLALSLILNDLEARYGFDRSCIVAHSMGGLVSRKLVGDHVSEGQLHAIRGLVTIASPLGGMPSAGMGVKMAPAVVQSWFDLDPASEFMASLYEDPLPVDIEYHLLFTFDDGGKSDGVVSLASQLRVEAQAEAEVVRGFRASHVGALYSDAVAAQVLTALARCRGSEAPRIAPRPPEPQVVEPPAPP